MTGLSQDRLKECCFRYLDRDEISYLDKDDELSGDDKKRKNLSPFLNYAVRNIFSHANVAENNGASQKNLLRMLCNTDQIKLTKWIYFYNLFERYEVRRYTSQASLLYIFSEQNLFHLARCLIEHSVDVGFPGERYGNALQAACANGHEQIARLLVDAKANVNAAQEGRSAGF